MSGAQPPVGASSGSSAAVPSPPPQQQQQEITAAQFSDAIREIIRRGARSESDELRGWLMLVATLTAGITYSAALNPPGGVWQADDAAKGYIAGTPVLLDKLPGRYYGFSYCNVTSFAVSLCIIVLSSIPWLYNRIQRLQILSNLVVLDLLALAGAFLAGSLWAGPYQYFYGAGLVVIGMSCFMSFEIWRLLAPSRYRPERVAHI